MACTEMEKTQHCVMRRGIVYRHRIHRVVFALLIYCPSTCRTVVDGHAWSVVRRITVAQIQDLVEAYAPVHSLSSLLTYTCTGWAKLNGTTHFNSL